ncbi:MAG TPA: hypothetical protein VMZ69_09380 [Saprospiraceae bacterium]|nr:hypothetical protein [Saprospiraceae bacterium]
MKYLLIITLIILQDIAFAQSVSNTGSVPQVFLIGQYEDQYMNLSKQHPAIFISVYNNDIDRAFRGWSEMLMDMEDYATSLNFDIRGVKLWFNIYFNADGSIQHLAFYPKPNSRNVPVEHLTAFFKNFVAQYHLPVKAEKAFQHSASAGFPTFFHRNSPTAKKD